MHQLLYPVLMFTGIGGTDPPSLERICDANRASQEAIQTFYAWVAFAYPGRSIPPGMKGVPEPCRAAEYWRHGDLVRVREDFVKEFNDVLILKDRRYLLGKHIADDGTATFGADLRASTIDLVDVWDLVLFSFRQRPLYEYLASVAHSASVRELALGDHPCIYVTFKDKDGRHEFWIDPAVNYLARKIVTVFNNGYRFEKEVVQFREFQPGVFFPEKMLCNSGSEAHYQKLAGRPYEEITLQDVRINAPIRDDVFKIKYPPRCVMADEIRGVWYEVDSEGKQVGEAHQLVPATPIAPDSPHSTSRGQTPLDADNTTSIPWTPIAILAAIVATSAAIVVRRRSGYS